MDPCELGTSPVRLRRNDLLGAMATEHGRSIGTGTDDGVDTAVVLTVLA